MSKEKNVYRVRVEQHPDEDHKRFYPEFAIRNPTPNTWTPDDQLEWKIMDNSNPFHFDFEDAIQIIKSWEDIQKDYTVEIIPYPDNQVTGTFSDFELAVYDKAMEMITYHAKQSRRFIDNAHRTQPENKAKELAFRYEKVLKHIQDIFYTDFDNVENQPID